MGFTRRVAHQELWSDPGDTEGYTSLAGLIDQFEIGRVGFLPGEGEFHPGFTVPRDMQAETTIDRAKNRHGITSFVPHDELASLDAFGKD